MNKLKEKIFLIIFSILSLITIGLFLTYNIKLYIENNKAIRQVLDKTINDSEMIVNRRNKLLEDRAFDMLSHKFPQDKIPFPINEIEDDKNKIFLDFKVYTVLLDNDNDFLGIISHTDLKSDVTKIKEAANEFIANYKKTGEKFHLNNLYKNKYSYIFKKDNTLIIVDNSKQTKTLRANLFLSILFLILCIAVIAFISYLLTRWIIRPVIKTFESQNKFIEDASHELKTPLAVIMSSIDAYQNDKDEKWINNIKDESDRMNGLIKELLDLSEIENNKNSEKDIKEKNNISTLVEKEILTCESLFFESNIKLKYDIEDDLYLNCNKNQIKQLVTILLDNAIKHSKIDNVYKANKDDKDNEDNSIKQKPKVNIKLSRNDSKEIVFEISNKSKPLEKGEEEKIFDRFYKRDVSRNRDSNSYGLGLAIAKEIVNYHDGKIEVKYNRGYITFTCTFKSE